MSFYRDLEIKKRLISDYIRKNNFATSRDLFKIYSIKVKRVYKDGMNEAYQQAGVIPNRP